MRDFKAYVRARLGSSGLPARDATKIVDELAGELEDFYCSLLDGGRSADEAWAEVQRQVPDWKALRAELVDGAPLADRLAHPDRAPFAGAGKRALFGRLRGLCASGTLKDLRLGLRRGRRSPGYTLTMLITLAVCFGANAAIFTVVDSVLLRPSPVPDAERIVVFADQFPAQDPNFGLLTNARAFFDRPGAVPAVEDQAMFRPTRSAIDVDGLAEQTEGLQITPSFFTLVRTQPAVGRAFTDADAAIGSEQKIILSHGLWQQMFAADPAAIGRDIELDGQRYTIVGVMPTGFSFFDRRVRFWTPLTFTAAQRTEDTPATRLTYGWYQVGRLRDGADLAQAQAQVDTLNAANIAAFPGIRDVWVNTGFHTVMIPLDEALVRDVSGTLHLLWAGAGFVLLIGTINLANLTLARSSVRARELATRVAIGASRWRIVRLLTLESVLLAALGGIAGLGVARLLLHAMRQQGLEAIPNADRIAMGLPVIGLTLASAIVVGTLIGLGASWLTRTPELGRALSEASRGGTHGRGARALRRGLVVAQVAISVVLLVGAVLLLASFRNLLRTDPGFDGANVVTAALSLPASRYAEPEAVSSFSERLLDAIRAVPGVANAGLTTNIPMGTSGGWSPIIADDYAATPDEAVVSPWRIHITPGYLETMGIPVVRGRGFDERDRADSEPVMLIDESLAARFWGDGDPLGGRMYFPTYPEDLNRTDPDTPFYTVVDVVRDVQLRDLSGRGGRAFGAQYFPQAQRPAPNFVVAIDTRASPDAVMRNVRAQIARLDPLLAPFDVRTMAERTDGSLASRKLALGLSTTFGAVALLLAALGIYGVLTYLVTQRRREIGIRIALGSTTRAVFRLVVSEGAWLTGVGLAFGVGGAFAVASRLEDQVFGIAPTDPVVLGAVVALCGAIALLACISPARHATRVDPITVLNDS